MICQICQRDVDDDYIEKHHLIPKCKRGTHGPTISVCEDCGNQLHVIFTNKELVKTYNSLDNILSNKKIQNWVKWIKKRPYMKNVCMKRFKKK